MPIAFAPLNESLTIVKILLEDSVKKRLNSLGLLVNANIEILNSPSNFKLNHIGNSNKEFFTPQYHKKNKKKSLDIPRLKKYTTK